MQKAKEKAAAPVQAALETLPEQEKKPPERQFGRFQLARSQAASASLPPPDGSPSLARAGAMIGSQLGSVGTTGRACLAGTLQRQAGNARVGRMARSVQRKSADVVSKSHPTIQFQLMVNQPGDAAEQEADNIAAHVTGKQPSATIQRQATSAATPDVTPEIESKINTNRGKGQRLTDSVRAPMEQAMGTDFSGVSVHTGSTADHLNRSLNARAFTTGQDIFFGQGEFNTGTSDGRELLAHELTHVVQQNGEQVHQKSLQAKEDETAKGSPLLKPEGDHIQRQPPGSGNSRTPQGQIPPPPTGLSGPVELKGKAFFSPPPDISEKIKSRLGQPVWVSVQFGSLAKGELPVIWNGIWFESGPPPPAHDGHPLMIDHVGFPTFWGARPMLAINIEKGVVTGGLGWRTSAGLSMDPAKFFAQYPLHKLLGLEGLETDPPDLTSYTSILRHGKLMFMMPVSFSTGNFNGEAVVSLKDEEYDFQGEISVNEVKGIDKPLPLKKEGTKLFASQTWKFERSLGAGGRLFGEIIGTFAGGKPDVRGTLKYSRAKPDVSATVTVVVTTFDIAKENVRDELGQDAPSSIQPGAPDDRLAIIGWGQADFRFNEWLTGNAKVIVHPEGYITAKGEIVPTVVIPILKKYEPEDKPLFTGSISKAIPSLDAIVADVSIKGSLDITGYASFGPGTLHDLKVTGLFSTHPDITNTFELSGIVSVPAVAGIKAVAKAKIAAQVWFGKKWEVASVGITINGNLALQLYAEAAAAAGRRKGDDDQPEYFVKGQLHGGAGLKLDLQIWLSGELAFWSKHIELLNRTYNITGGSVTIDFDYILGGKKKKGEDALKLSVKLGDFNQDKFADAVVRGETVEDKKYKGKDQAEGQLDTVPNPDAPPPVEPPDPTNPIPPGTPTGVEKSLGIWIWMEREQHYLKLTLTDPPGITMQTVLEPLLRKIDRARKDLKKDKGLGDAEKASRLAALNKIEASAKGVQAAAARVAKNPAYITPQVPGFTELGHLIEDYGNTYNVTDLGVALDKVVVDPSKPESILQKFPGLASDTLVKAQVSRIIAAGVEATDLRRIVENVRPVKEDGVLEILGLLELMINSGATNWDRVITDLRIGGNKFKGAIFVLRYIREFLDWSEVGFEVTDDPLDTTGRRWDIWASGVLYEFKSWYSWPDIASRTFLRQILEDYHKVWKGGDKLPLRWVFFTSLSKDEIVGKMKQALDGVIADIKAGQEPKVNGYTEKIALFISSRVESIVSVKKQ